MKRENEMKQLLIDNAIHLIAEGGFEKATTKELTFCGGSLPDVKMNEVYIYRLFGSKEELFAQAFSRLDREVFSAIKTGAAAVDRFDHRTKEKLYDVFLATWQYAVDHEEHGRCYVRYYYSAYFKGKSQEQHLTLFEEMIRRLLPIFKQDADVIAILHSVFTAFFDFAVRVYNGELENSEENRAHIFHVLYCMLASYLNESPADQSEFESESE